MLQIVHIREAMARFPRTQSEKSRFYDALSAGIAANPAEFPNGVGDPFDPTALDAAIAQKNAAVNALNQLEAALKAATADARQAFEACDEIGRGLIDLGIAHHGVRSVKLVLIGYGPRAPRTPKLPGQPRMLLAAHQGPGMADLNWKPPKGSGGRVSFYRILRTKRSLAGVTLEAWGVWQASTTGTAITLGDLERGVEYDFAVVAVNPAGESVQSNLVTVVV